jgi:hypothetical protein
VRGKRPNSIVEKERRPEGKQEERENQRQRRVSKDSLSLSAIYILSSLADKKYFPLFLSVGTYILHLEWTLFHFFLSLSLSLSIYIYI